MCTKVVRCLGKKRPAIQACPARALHARTPSALFLPAAVALLSLAGCSGGGSLNPVDWWHGLQGGPLDTARPPPPNADAPYPNLATVPPKGAPPDMNTPNQIAKALIADRENAHYTAGLSPLQAPQATNVLPRPAATPGGAGGGDALSASLQAASAPPPPPAQIKPLGPPQPPLPNAPVTPPKPAPVGAVQTTPLEQPPGPSSGPPPGTAVVRSAPGADLPAMPDQPPPLPQLAGVDLPTRTVPTPPPPTPPAPPAPPGAPGAPVTIAFTPGSAVLPRDAAATLKQLAVTRGNAPISVIGYGEASSNQADAQTAALPLALARARAIAAGLGAAGVPSDAIRIAAEAEGQGGAARIVSN
ncbi:MAG TPA: OmpA family protein [Acetobacteraceae bacterium]|jgi:outer membrane protein OmpA-like peptidoglycan-associated protein|nr:OmpA family protein [Acetobacteraceae bacterium]